MRDRPISSGGKARQADRADVSEAKAAKFERTRQRILDAAAQVLSTNGFAGTRLSDIAEQADLQTPTIYYYFRSREELIEEVMFCGISEMRLHIVRVLDALPAHATALDKVMSAMEAHLRHELELSAYTTASIRNAGQMPKHLQLRQRKEEAAYGKIWHGLFVDAISDSGLHSDIDPRTARLLVMGALNWAAEWWDPRRDSVETVIQTAQTIVRVAFSSHPQQQAP
ncbi:TetR/AcrR family transcriptional regulator [Mycolicibacterium neoaurum]|uniref:TetR/AcrR family transcriptional regulator n=1 Tax=Mycolicibacterium neoaurum TaxID=1795 RepID=UPI003AFFC991